MIFQKAKEKDKIFLFLNNFDKKMKNYDFVEIRCIKLDGRGKKIIGEQTWPDFYKLFLNNSGNLLISDIKVQKSSSINKRKDKQYFITKKDFLKKIGIIDKPFFMLEFETIFDEKNSFWKDKDYIYYELIVLGTKKINFKNFLKNTNLVTNFETGESLNFIKKLFGGEEKKNLKKEFLKKKEEDEIIIDELKMDIICKLTYTKMNFPGRGNNCYHLNCFSIKSFFFTLQASEFKKIYCPICKNPIQFIFYDKLVEKIINDCEDDKEFVSFNNFGDFEKIAICDKNKKNDKKILNLENDKKEILILSSDEDDKKEKIKKLNEADKFLDEILNDDKKYEEICQFLMKKLLVKNSTVNLDKDNYDNCKYFNLSGN